MTHTTNAHARPPRVELLEICGSDEGIALSAWTSTSRDIDDDKRVRVPALLARLWNDGHHTPFEKSYFRFLVKCDKATEIHFLKHRIGVSVNGESARYKTLTNPTAHIPADWPEDLQRDLEAHFAKSAELYERALVRLSGPDAYPGNRKRAKESARYFLPMCLQTTLDVSFNWRSFAHFLSLRASPHAQREVREIALAMLDLVEERGGFSTVCALMRAELAKEAES